MKPIVFGREEQARCESEINYYKWNQ